MLPRQGQSGERLRSNSEDSADDGITLKTTAPAATYTRSPVTSIGDDVDFGRSPATSISDDLSPVNGPETTFSASTSTPLRDAQNTDWWMPDNACKDCHKCEERFHFFLRRHHCRLCGLIFCWKCSNHFVYGHEFGFKQQNQQVRCCDDCFSVLPTLQNTAATVSSRKTNKFRFQENDGTKRSNRNIIQSGGGSGGKTDDEKQRMEQQGGGGSSRGGGSSDGLSKSYKVSRTGTKGVNARYDGQTYDGRDLEFDDLHEGESQGDGNGNGNDDDDDSPDRREEMRRRRKLKSATRRRSRKSSTNDGFFPTNPSSDDSGGEGESSFEEEKEEDHFVTGTEALSGLTKSPRIGSVGGGVGGKGKKIRKKKNHGNNNKTGRSSGSVLGQGGPSSARKSTKNDSSTTRGRSISMKPDSYRERVLSSMTPMSSSSSSIGSRHHHAANR